MVFSLISSTSVLQCRSLLNSLSQASKMSLKDLKDVDIDPEGVFKYILIKAYESGENAGNGRNLVRGYKRCSYHADIYEEVTRKELKPLKIESECLGGGRIQHDPSDKKMKVYGYSQGFGKADHSVSADLLKKSYPDYSITWSDEGY